MENSVLTHCIVVSVKFPDVQQSIAVFGAFKDRIENTFTILLLTFLHSLLEKDFGIGCIPSYYSAMAM